MLDPRERRRRVGIGLLIVAVDDDGCCEFVEQRIPQLMSDVMRYNGVRIFLILVSCLCLKRTKGSFVCPSPNMVKRLAQLCSKHFSDLDSRTIEQNENLVQAATVCSAFVV